MIICASKGHRKAAAMSDRKPVICKGTDPYAMRFVRVVSSDSRVTSGKEKLVSLLTQPTLCVCPASD